ncbi:hypothetical protein [Cellulomonas fulva]|nr:hypothetical protein [Cellulomonas fulva]
MSTPADTPREHPTEPAEGSPTTTGADEPTSDPREHAEDPAEGA